MNPCNSLSCLPTCSFHCLTPLLTLFHASSSTFFLHLDFAYPQAHACQPTQRLHLECYCLHEYHFAPVTRKFLASAAPVSFCNSLHKLHCAIKEPSSRNSLHFTYSSLAQLLRPTQLVRQKKKSSLGLHTFLNLFRRHRGEYPAHVRHQVIQSSLSTVLRSPIRVTYPIYHFQSIIT